MFWREYHNAISCHFFICNQSSSFMFCFCYCVQIFLENNVTYGSIDLCSICAYTFSTLSNCITVFLMNKKNSIKTNYDLDLFPAKVCFLMCFSLFFAVLFWWLRCIFNTISFSGQEDVVIEWQVFLLLVQNYCICFEYQSVK